MRQKRRSKNSGKKCGNKGVNKTKKIDFKKRPQKKMRKGNEKEAKKQKRSIKRLQNSDKSDKNGNRKICVQSKINKKIATKKLQKGESEKCCQKKQQNQP